MNKKNVPPTTSQKDGPYNDKRSLKLQSNSCWNPPSGSPNFEYVIAIYETGLLTTQPHARRTQPNISRNDAKCLADLANDRNIVIKKADKGEAVVMQNRRDYVKEDIRQLSDGKFYEKMNSDLTASHNEIVKTQLQNMTKQGEITKSVCDFLTYDSPRTPEFYMLPKIHKGTVRLPGRPIISANNSPTERISAFEDHFLRPIQTVTNIK